MGERSKRRRWAIPGAIGFHVVLAIALGVFAKLWVTPHRIYEKDSSPVTIAMRPQPVPSIDVGDRPRALFDSAGLPDPRASGDIADEPRIFFPGAEESDHNESNDGEDYGQMKGDSKDALSSIPETDGGVKSALRGRRSAPGVNDSIGVGGGSGSSARYGSRNGGGQIASPPRPSPGPVGTRLSSSATKGGSSEGDVGQVEAARRLATVSEPRPPAPELLVRTRDKLEPVPLEALRVSVVLGATRARVLVDATFSIERASAPEGTFNVSLPEGASPVYLGTFQGAGRAGLDPASLLDRVTDPTALLEGGSSLTAALQPASKEAARSDWGELRPARVVEQAKAKVVYEATTRRRVDPALMEWSSSNKFTTRVFPLPQGGRKRIVFAYDVTPHDEGGLATLGLPVPEKPPAAFRLELAADARAYASARLVSATARTLDSALVGQGDFVRAEVREVGSGALELAATPRASLVRAGCSRSPGLPGSLVHARLFPAVAASETRPTGDAIFVLDTSLSQRTRLATSCGRLLRAILQQDRTIARFRVLAFDVKARELTDGWRPNSPEARAAVNAAVESIWLEGATSLEAALDGLESMIAPAEHPTLFLLSDAQVTWGVEEPRELERAHPRLFAERWIGYQLGDAPTNRPLLECLTRSAGRIVSVAPGEADEAGFAHATTPLSLENVRVEGAFAQDLVVAGSPRALFPGQELEVAFRLPEGAQARAATVVLETRAGEMRFPLAQATLEDPLAGRAWAELTATRLLEVGDERADAVALALSQRFALANRVASFLILETDAEYKQHALEPAALDLSAITRAASERDARRPSGAPDLSDLAPRVRAFLADVRGERGTAWPRPVTTAPARSLARPSWPERLDPVLVHADAVRRAEAAHLGEALRVLSSLVEESPRDAQALRLTGYQLMAWGLYEDAASLFARTRTLRPFEPQAWLAEAVALEALGQVGEAAVRYEHVLAGKFDPRFEQFAKTTARRLYARLLQDLSKLGAQRLAEVWTDREAPRTGFEAIIFWNLEDTDVDLHVVERRSGEIDYRRMRSDTGGLLHWDNTVGLGPELYTHPSQEPREIFAHYYGTRSMAGTVPAATLLLTWKDGLPLGASCALLETQGKRNVLWRGDPEK